MSTKEHFFEIAEKAGITVDFMDGYRNAYQAVPWSVDLWAPDGMQFIGSACTVDCSIQGKSMKPSKKDWERAVEILSLIVEEGFEPLEEEEEA